jgi:hypothetical protein
LLRETPDDEIRARCGQGNEEACDARQPDSFVA